MNYHTIICGTSKSREGYEYFQRNYPKPNIDNFWGTLRKANVFHEIKGDRPQTQALNKRGILLTDLSAAKGGKERRDNAVKIKNLRKGLARFKHQIINSNSLNTIAFVGKESAKWFIIHFLDEIDFVSDAEATVLPNYGLQKWYCINKHVEYFVLPNIQNLNQDEGSIKSSGKVDYWVKFWYYIYNKNFQL
jgi:hypothetical protein